MTSPPPLSAPPPAPGAGGSASAGRVRRRVTLLVLVLGALAGGAWRYRVTRTEYRFARGEDALRAGDTEGVRAYADRLEAAGAPDHAHLLRGEALLTFGAPDRALAQLNQVRAEGPLRVRAAALSGRCLLALGDLKEAHRVFRFVVAEQADHLDGLRGLAAIAYDLGQMIEAIEFLRRVAELDPADSRPHRLIGLIYKDMAQDPLAEEAYREALRRGLPPEVERAVRVEVAEVCARQAKFAEGLAVLDGGPPSDDPAAGVARAECLRGLGRQPQAADVLDAALARQPTAALYRLRGQVYEDQARPADARRCYERAIELAPTDRQAHFLLGQVLAGSGHAGDAARAFARAEELRKDLDRISALSREAMQKPWDPVVRLELAELCDRLGKPQLAAMWRKAAAACRETPR